MADSLHRASRYQPIMGTLHHPGQWRGYSYPPLPLSVATLSRPTYPWDRYSAHTDRGRREVPTMLAGILHFRYGSIPKINLRVLLKWVKNNTRKRNKEILQVLGSVQAAATKRWL